MCHDLFHRSVRPEVERKGLVATKESCWAYYVQKCRNNLHVVLAMSPVGETLRTRCRNFPGMVNNTVIDWFEPWPEQVRVIRCAVEQIFIYLNTFSPLFEGPAIGGDGIPQG